MTGYLRLRVALEAESCGDWQSDAQTNSLLTDLTAEVYATVQRFAAARLALGQDVASGANCRGMSGVVTFDMPECSGGDAMTGTAPAEVRGLFRRVVAAARRAGVDTEGWWLREAIPITGGPWQVLDARGHTVYVGHLPLLHAHTHREASLSLSAMERAYESVAAARGRACRGCGRVGLPMYYNGLCEVCDASLDVAARTGEG